MQEPFDIIVGTKTYSIFPEEDNIYTVFKEGIEYLKIQKDEDHWLKLDPQTELPQFEQDEEVDQIGLQINKINQE